MDLRFKVGDRIAYTTKEEIYLRGEEAEAALRLDKLGKGRFIRYCNSWFYDLTRHGVITAVEISEDPEGNERREGDINKYWYEVEFTGGKRTSLRAVDERIESLDLVEVG